MPLVISTETDPFNVISTEGRKAVVEKSCVIGIYVTNKISRLRSLTFAPLEMTVSGTGYA